MIKISNIKAKVATVIFTLILITSFRSTYQSDPKEIITYQIGERSYEVAIDENGVKLDDLDSEVSSKIRAGFTLTIDKEQTIYVFEDKQLLLLFATNSMKSVRKTQRQQLHDCSSPYKTYFYEHSHFEGGTFIPRFDDNKVLTLFLNDQFSSVITDNNSSGVLVTELYEHSNFGGRQHIMIAGPFASSYISDLKSVGLGDKISSFRRFYL